MIKTESWFRDSSATAYKIFGWGGGRCFGVGRSKATVCYSSVDKEDTEGVFVSPMKKRQHGEEKVANSRPAQSSGAPRPPQCLLLVTVLLSMSFVLLCLFALNVCCKILAFHLLKERFLLEKGRRRAPSARLEQSRWRGAPQQNEGVSKIRAQASQHPQGILPPQLPKQRLPHPQTGSTRQPLRKDLPPVLDGCQSHLL